jgi:hypothetical protein
VLLYRSVAKLSERAGVLGEDAGNEAPGRICNKHGGGHEDANEEIAVLFAHRALHLGKILCPNDHYVVMTFPRKRYYLSF